CLRAGPFLICAPQGLTTAIHLGPGAGFLRLPKSTVRHTFASRLRFFSALVHERILGYGHPRQPAAEFPSRPYRTADQFAPRRTPRKAAHQSSFRGPLACPPCL